MTGKSIDELVVVARSWSCAPPLRLKGAGFTSAGYDRGERAYRLALEDGAGAAALEFELDAGDESPVYNIPLVIRNWGEGDAELMIDGKKIKCGKSFRLGHRRRLEGSDLIVWIRAEASKPVSVLLSPAGKE